MRLKNTTKADSALLREMVRFACPPGVANFSIWFKNYAPETTCWRVDRATGARTPVRATGFCGRCYYGRRHIVCRISRRERLARPYNGAGDVHGNGYLPWNAYTWEEAVIALIAHELRHLWQLKHRRGRVWGARGRQSERECDAYAIRVMRAWRRRANAPAERDAETKAA